MSRGCTLSIRRRAGPSAHQCACSCSSPPDVGSKIQLEHILYKVGVGTRCGEGKRHPDDGPDAFCTFPWSEMVVEDL